MTKRTLSAALALALLAALGWFAWRWHSAPRPPRVPLDGARRELADEIEKASAAVRARPRDAAPWGRLGQLLLANGFDEPALECLAHARRLDPADPRWHYLHGSVSLILLRPDDAADSLRRALDATQDREQRAAVLFLLAQALIDEGRLDEAGRRAAELRAAEDGPRAHYALGLLALAGDDRAAAREHLAPLAEHPCARRQVCSLLAGLTPDAAAAEGFRLRAAALPPDAPWPNSFDDDVRRFRVEAGGPLGLYDTLLAAGRADEAADYLRDLVARSPSDEACYQLALEYDRRGKSADAEKALRQAVGLNARHLKANLLLAGMLYEKGAKAKDRVALAEAVEAADRALAEGDLALAHLVRGQALDALGRDDEALASLRRAALAGPNRVDAHLALGEKLASVGRVREGLVHLEDAARLADAKDDRPRKALEKWRGKGPKP